MAKKKGPHWGAILLDDTPEMMGHIAGIFTEVARCMHCDVDTVRQGILNLYRRGMTSEKPQKRSAWAPLHGSGEEPTPEEILLFLTEMPILISLPFDREPFPSEQNPPAAPCTPGRSQEDGWR